MYSQLLQKYAARKAATWATNSGKSVRLTELINTFWDSWLANHVTTKRVTTENILLLLSIVEESVGLVRKIDLMLCQIQGISLIIPCAVYRNVKKWRKIPGPHSNADHSPKRNELFIPRVFLATIIIKVCIFKCVSTTDLYRPNY